MSAKNRKILFLTMLTVFSFLTGCGQTVAQSGKVSGNEIPSCGFEFKVEDTFALTIGGVVVTGYVQSGTMCTGDSAWLVKEDGTMIETGVAAMETYDAGKKSVVSTEEVGEGITAGVLLEGLEKDQVDAGDILRGKEK